MVDSVVLGVLGAFVAVLGWGLGDYLGAHVARRWGALPTTFSSLLVLALVSIPFIEWDKLALLPSALVDVGFVGLVLVLAGFFFYFAMRKGQIAVVEPVSALELVFTLLLAFFLLGEQAQGLQLVFLALSIAGGVLISLSGKARLRDFLVPGAFLALLAAAAFGYSDFLQSSVVNELGAGLALFSSTLIASVLLFVYLFVAQRDKLRLLLDKKVIVAGVVEGAGWLGFAYSLALLPLFVAAGIYNAFPAATILAAFAFDRERLSTRQWLGAFLLISSAVALGLTAGVSR